MRAIKIKTRNFAILFFSLILTLAVFSQIKAARSKPTSDVGFDKQGWFYSKTSNDLTAYLGKKGSNIPTVRYQKNEHFLEFSMSQVGGGLTATTTAVSLETNSKEPNTPTLFYRNIAEDIDAAYKITNLPFQVKEEIVLKKNPKSEIRNTKQIQNPNDQNSKQENTTFLFNSSTNAIPIKQPNGSIYFYDNQNNYLFQIDKPFMTDGKGTVSNDVIIEIVPVEISSSYKVKNNLQFPTRLPDGQVSNFQSIFNNPIFKPITSSFSSLKIKHQTTSDVVWWPTEYQIILKADTDWLNDPSRIYPVIIDPTITHNADANFSGEKNRIADADSTSSTQLESSYPEATLDPYTVLLLHFNEANGATSGIKDYASTTRVITANGNASTTSHVTQLGLGNSAAFDGVGDYLTLTSDSDDYTWSTDFSVDMWIRFNDVSTYQVLIAHSDDTGSNFFRLGWASTAGQWSVVLGVVSNQITDSLLTNTWYHIAVIRTGSTVRFFRDGKQVGSDITDSTSINASTNGIDIGANWNEANTLNGYLDSLRIIKGRALTPEEIKAAASRRPYAVYTSPVLDATASVQWDTLNWTEGGVSTGDGEILYNSSGLVAQWNFNETSGTTADNAEGTAALDGTLNGFSYTASQDQATTTTGWTANNKKWGAGALMFDGTNDYVSVGDNDAWNFGSGDFTIDFWVKVNTIATGHGFYMQREDASNKFMLYWTTSNRLYFYIVDAGVDKALVYATWTPTVGKWHYITYERSGSTINIYIDGVLQSLTTTTAIGSYSLKDFSAEINIGKELGNNLFLSGILDSMRIYKGRALSASEILSNYQAGNIEFQTRTGATSDPNDGSWEAWKPTTGETQLLSMDNDAANWHSDIMASTTIATSTDTVIKTEGTGSLKIKMGMASTTANTVALWHFEETGTSTGTYLYDETANNNDATTTGTTVVDGIFGKARSFDGDGDYVSVADNDGWDFTGDVTIDFWVKPTNLSVNNGFFIQTANGLADTNAHYAYYDIIDGIHWNAKNGSEWITGVTLSVGEWANVALVRSNSDLFIYKNGKLATTTTTTGIKNGIAAELIIGDAANVPNFNGTLDSIRIIKGRALSADEIAETYRMGANHHLTRQVSAVDLSAQTKLPFWIAADRTGTFLEAMIGESDFANYELASSTLALSTATVLYIKGDEIASSTSIKDSSFSGKTITANGNARTSGTGKIGNSLYFDGTGDYLSLANSSDWSLGTAGGGNYTINFWTRWASLGATTFAQVENGPQTNGWELRYKNSTNVWQLLAHGVEGAQVSWTPSVNVWYHVALVRSGSVVTIYVDGVSKGTFTDIDMTNNGYALTVGAANNGAQPHNGNIDEYRIIKGTALTPDQIRQAYEYGLRSHPITIDFGATLQPSDLISSATDYGFSLTATTSGLSATTSGLYLGDKIIIKENLGGTEYAAQGTVNAINTSTGAITVPSWDSGSTFPSGNGYSPNATVFKWQREYFDLTVAATTTRDAITNLTLRPTNGAGGRTVYMDDFRYNTNYLTASSSSTITSSNNRYLQYRTIFTSTDTFVSPFLSAFNTLYTSLANSFPSLIGVSGGGFLSF